MLLLIVYVLIALGFSFLCSIAEAVILSVSSAYISVLEKEGKPSGALLRKHDLCLVLAYLSYSRILNLVNQFLSLFPSQHLCRAQSLA